MTERILLDVNSFRARIEGGLDVQLGVGDPIRLDHVDLDTGSGFDLLVSPVLFGGLPPEATPTDRVETLGRSLEAWTLEVVLSRPDKRWEAVAQLTLAHISGPPRALLGLPILRRFDLLLREDPTDPRRPAMVFTPLR